MKQTETRRTAGILGTMAAAAVLIAAAPAFADNQSSALAYHLPPDGTLMTDYVIFPGAGGVTERWYVTTLKGGRNYTIQDVIDFSNPTSARLGFIAPTLFASDGVSPAPGNSAFISLLHPQAYTSPGGTPLVTFAGGDRLR